MHPPMGLELYYFNNKGIPYVGYAGIRCAFFSRKMVLAKQSTTNTLATRSYCTSSWTTDSTGVDLSSISTSYTPHRLFPGLVWPWPTANHLAFSKSLLVAQYVPECPALHKGWYSTNCDLSKTVHLLPFGKLPVLLPLPLSVPHHLCLYLGVDFITKLETLGMPSFLLQWRCSGKCCLRPQSLVHLRSLEAFLLTTSTYHPGKMVCLCTRVIHL